MKNILYSWVVLTLIYPAELKVYISTESISFIGHNVLTPNSKGTMIQSGPNRFNVKETPEQVLKLIEEANAKDELNR